MFCILNSCFWLLFCFCMHVFLLFFSVYVTVVIGCLPLLLPLLPTLLLKYYYYHLDATDHHLHCVRRNLQWWPRSMLQSSTFGKWRRTSGRRVSSLKWGGNSREDSCPEPLPAHTRPSVLTHGTSPCSCATSWEITDTRTQVRSGSFYCIMGGGEGRRGAPRGGSRAVALRNRNLKNTDFVDIMISKVLRDLPLQPKSAIEIGWWLVH
jgi:hypothetical protein